MDANGPRRKIIHPVPRSMHYCIRRSSEHVALQLLIQHGPLLRGDHDVVLVHVRIDPHIRIRILFQPATHDRYRHERPSKLVRRSVAGFHVGRRQLGGRERDVGHVSQRNVLTGTVVLPNFEYHRPFGTPAAAPLSQDLDLM